MIGKTNASSGSMQLCQGETGSLVLPTSTSFDVSVNGIFQEEYNKNSITVHLPSEECYLLINCWGGTSGKIYFDYGNTFFAELNEANEIIASITSGANSASILYHKGGEEDLKISMNKTFKYCATYLIDVK